MPITSHYRFFATAPKYTETLLLQELRPLNVLEAAETVGGVSFTGDLVMAYQACLWSRIANRVLLELKKTRVDSPEDLYDAIYSINWQEHFTIDDTFAIDFFSTQSAIAHSQFGAQKCKDAIVDQFRRQSGERPSVDKKNPAIRINVHVKKSMAVISLDLSGHSLHQRGYRTHNVEAPLKENLAAAVLMRANWPALAQAGLTLIDPMCGSGTLLIEASCMAANIAPGLFRRDFGFNVWKRHEENLWQTLRREAESARQQNPALLPNIIGFDNDPDAISATQHNLKAAGLEQLIKVRQQNISVLRNEGYGASGLIVTNAPYGQRLGDNQSLLPVYEQLGKQLKSEFRGWNASVVTSDAALAKATGLHARRINKLYNGKLLCHIYHFDPEGAKPVDKPAAAGEAAHLGALKPESHSRESIIRQTPKDTALENRLKKNLAHLQKWAGKRGVACYRIYDADLPEFNFAVDCYRSDKLFVVLQEYAAPKYIDASKVNARKNIILSTLGELLDLPGQQIFYK
ncbi:MAG: bifunctional 23S rRNA (guanine(2069)-N(7))-methyltransferase RlmK/23S rRNA (guanine(2445)-N(2))-methyltransferase RlmL, partial [Gammaproteobacteria bacterium]|nr:bifunctional 23S rRNA (guanine(2069)-N(7))-methyltransferase RlmK/23S rRNA (guanine(2445)-N(2))-methyltransferase RlmL [Gammaproteobacteria bacterium]